MRQLKQIAEDVKAHVGTAFGAVIITASQLDEQLQEELRTFGSHRLPAIVIAFEGGDFSAENTIRELRLTLLTVDRFESGTDSAGLAAFRCVDKLQELFPPQGIRLAECIYFPGAIYAASGDPSFVCFAQTVTVKQGI